MTSILYRFVAFGLLILVLTLGALGQAASPEDAVKTALQAGAKMPAFELKDATGKVAGFMTLQLDITERKRIQAEIAQKEAEFRFALVRVSGKQSIRHGTTFQFVIALVIGITAGEAKDPKKSIPKAINSVPWRILVFYVGTLFVIMSIYPWNQVGTNGSPFVLTFAKIGIVAAAGIINFVVLTAALSGCNSGMYSGGRMLYALAKNRQLPAALTKLSASGVPVNCIAVTIGCLLVGSALNYIIPNPEQVFVYVYSASVLPGMVPWFVVLISQLYFRRAHKEAIKNHSFKSIMFPYVNYLTIAFLVCVLVGMGINPDTRISLLVGAIFLAGVSLCYFAFGMHKKHHPAENRVETRQ